MYDNITELKSQNLGGTVFPYCCPPCKCNLARNLAGPWWRWKLKSESYKIFVKEKLKVTYNLDTQYSYAYNQDPAWSNPPANCSYLGIYKWEGIWAWASVCYSIQSYNPPDTTTSWGGVENSNYTWSNIVAGSWSHFEGGPVWPPDNVNFFQNDALRYNFHNLDFSYDYHSAMLESDISQNGQAWMDYMAQSVIGVGGNPMNDANFKSLVFANINLNQLSNTWNSGPINADTANTVQDTYPVPYTSLPQGQTDFWFSKYVSSPMNFYFRYAVQMGPPQDCYFCCDVITNNNDNIDIEEFLLDLV